MGCERQMNCLFFTQVYFSLPFVLSLVGLLRQTSATFSTTSIPVGATQCLSCSMGTFADDVGQPTCELCPPGYFSNGTNATMFCDPCPYGTYSDKYGSMACTACPNGTTTLNDPLGNNDDAKYSCSAKSAMYVCVCGVQCRSDTMC